MSKLIIDQTGSIAFIYTDELRELLTEGRAEIRRVSHVEPVTGGGWAADMSPIGGPMLAVCETRADALASELAFLEREGF
jgi:hypothetical protein